MGRSLSIIKRCSAFLTTLSTRQVLQALVFSHLDYCSDVWSVATKKDLGKLQLVQNRAAWLALGCTRRANINNMHVNLSWLKVEEWLTSSLPVFVRGWQVQHWHVECTKLSVWTTYTQLGHPCIPHKTCHKRSLHSPQIQNRLWETQYYIETWLHGTLFHSTT